MKESEQQPTEKRKVAVNWPNLETREQKLARKERARDMFYRSRGERLVLANLSKNHPHYGIIIHTMECRQLSIFVLKMDEECIGTGYEDCTEKAVYLRYTQFAGTHPLCEKHAKEDKDFLKNDSYQFWKKIS